MIKHKNFTDIRYLNNAEFRIGEVLQKLINASSSKDNKILLQLLSDEIKKQIGKIKEVKFHALSYQ